MYQVGRVLVISCSTFMSIARITGHLPFQVASLIICLPLIIMGIVFTCFSFDDEMPLWEMYDEEL